MTSSQASSSLGRWGEVLLGGMAASVGAPAVMKGVRRVLGLGGRGSPVGLGWTAGLLGALVAGGLASRRAARRGRPDVPALAPPGEAPGSRSPEEDAAPRGERTSGDTGPAPEPLSSEPYVPGPWRARRGPSGRERFWAEAGPPGVA